MLIIGTALFVGRPSALDPRAGSGAEGVRLILNFMLTPLLMKKSLSVWQRRWRRYWPWVLTGVFILLIFCLLAPCLFRSWTHYPEALRAEIAWRRFRSSFTDNCREDCLAARQSYAAIWRPFYQKNPDAAEINFQEVFKTGKPELQAALIKIMAADNDKNKLPPILAELIADPQTSLENKRLIVNFFPEAFKDEVWLKQVRSQAVSADTAAADRLYALRLLAAFPDAETVALVKNLILEHEDAEFLETALNVAAGWPRGTIIWSDADLAALSALIIREPVGSGRWRRLWLLVEAGSDRPEKLRSLLTELAGRQDLDKISRGLAADALRTKFNFDINPPAPSAQEWQEFYEDL